MNRKNEGENGGCLLEFIAVYIILTIVGSLSNAVGSTAALIIIGAIILVIVLISKSSKQTAEGEREHEKNLSIVNSVVQFDSNMVSLKLVSDGRKITNNIFNLKFEQNEQADEKAPTEYETFVVDTYGQIISDIKTICEIWRIIAEAQ